MTTLLWCSLAALVGAVAVMGMVTRGAILEMRDAYHYRDLQRTRVSDAEREKQEAMNVAEELGRALAEEKRQHRLLLASRERKRADNPLNVIAGAARAFVEIDRDEHVAIEELNAARRALVVSVDDYFGAPKFSDRLPTDD